MAKAFLAAGEQRCLIARLDNDDAIRIKARLSKGRRKKVGTRNAPQHLARGAGGDAGGEEDSCGAVKGAGGAAGDFMQRGEGEAATRQGAIDRVESERKGCRVGAPGAHAADVVPKLAQQRFVPHLGLP